MDRDDLQEIPSSDDDDDATEVNTKLFLLIKGS